jgi:hypothetical protein
LLRLCPRSCVFLRVAVSFLVLGYLVFPSHACGVVMFLVGYLALKEIVLVVCVGIRVGHVKFTKKNCETKKKTIIIFTLFFV